MPVPVPIADRRSRLREQGRLRLGVRTTSRTGKVIPTSIETWRATSSDREAIEAIAGRYGGITEPWTDAPSPGQWQVITDAARLAVLLPEDPLRQDYELWDGPRLRVRCDGVTAVVPRGDDLEEHPCRCARRGVMECKQVSNLDVLLPDIDPFGGTWRVRTQSTQAFDEWPAMVELIRRFQERGFSHAILGVDRRRSKQVPGKQYPVPVLMPGHSLNEVAAGAGRAVLGPAPRALTISTTDASVADAEVIDDGATP